MWLCSRLYKLSCHLSGPCYRSLRKLFFQLYISLNNMEEKQIATLAMSTSGAFSPAPSTDCIVYLKNIIF